MRRRLAAGMTLVALLTGVLAGCATLDLPAEVDKKLTDDWPKTAEAKVQVPAVGICLQYGNPLEKPMGCDKPHMVEVVHVGTFTEDAKPSPTRLAAAYAECDTEAAKYLGRPWWDARLELNITLPRDVAWEGGARWFRCDVQVVGDAGSEGARTMKNASLKGAIPAELLMSCTNAAEGNNEVRAMTDVACAKRHNAEWVGFFRAGPAVPYPTSDRQWSTLHNQCQAQIAKYLGVSTAAARYVGIISVPRGTTAWKAGNHAVRCAIWFDDKTMTKSAKGSKGKGVPYF